MFLKSVLPSLMLAVALFAAPGAHAQEPTISQVYAAAQANRMPEAQAMMAQVLRAHPDSAKAHYVEAELLAKQGRYTSAQTELGTAERLQPQLGFAKPEAVSELKSVITSGLSGYPTTASPARASAARFPWGWMLIIALSVLVLLVMLIRATAARRMGGGATRGPGYGPMATPMSPYGGMPMSPYGPMGGGMGSGLLGGLASGAAMGAGLVAGEELMHHLTDHGTSGGSLSPSPSDTPMPPQENMGGQDFGLPDGSSWDDGGGSSWDDGGSMGGGDWN